MTDELKLNMAEKLTAIVGKDRVLVDEAMSRHTTFIATFRNFRAISLTK